LPSPLALLALFGLVMASAQPASAQDGGSNLRFRAGPVQWAPTLILREAGTDSNVLSAPANQPAQKDRMATFIPQLDAVLKMRFVELTGQGMVGVIYYERTTSQRAVNPSGNWRAEFPIQRIRPAISGRWTRTTDRSGNEIDIRAESVTWTNTASMSLRVMSRLSLLASGDIQKTVYDRSAVFKDQNLATNLDRQTTGVTSAIRVDISPLTQLMIDIRGSRDVFILTPEKQTDNLFASAGLEFSPDAVIKGHATIGYHKMVPRRTGGFPFAGITASVDLGYVFLGRTRIDLRFARDTNYSVLDGEGYYLSTAGGLELMHNLIGPVDLTLRGSREQLDYTRSVGGLVPRLDFANTYGGGLSVRLSPTARLGANYEVSERVSSTGVEGGFKRERLYTTITYGF
jgi:hypothetical protein